MHTLSRVILLLAVALGLGGCGEGHITAEPDVVYGEAGGQKLRLDVFLPAAKPGRLRAAVLTLHGGAWRAGSKEESHDFAKMLAKEGYVTFAVGYRLATPEGNHWPAQLDDVQRAVRWVRENAARYGIDPQRIGAAGGSAGGHLVACLATMDTRDNSDPALAGYSSRVACIVDMCGPTDLTEDFAPKVKQGAWCNEQVAVLLGGTPAQVPGAARSASPLLHVDKRSAPALIIHGRNDELVPLDNAERFAAALRENGVEARLFLHDEGHGVENFLTLVRMVTEIRSFLAARLAP